jgi:HlyD family secretion protein
LVDERHEVLLVPNAALRFTPAVMSDQPNPGSNEDRSSPLDSAKDARIEGQARGTVWVPEGRAVRPIAVRIGLTDGSVTEVEGLEEGAPLVVGEPQDEADGLSYRSPFAPQFSKDSRTRPVR